MVSHVVLNFLRIVLGSLFLHLLIYESSARVSSLPVMGEKISGPSINLTPFSLSSEFKTNNRDKTLVFLVKTVKLRLISGLSLSFKHN